MCPNCQNTLTVVPSDPPDNDDGRPPPIISAAGEPPFFLYCNHCRWDSAEVGITFEKPTGLAGACTVNCTRGRLTDAYIPAQLQKFEDSAPEALEFERLKEHFEPYLRASPSTSSHALGHTPSTHINPITAAASSALSRDIPGVARYTPLAMVRSRSGREKNANKHDVPDYRARFEVGSTGLTFGGGADRDVGFLRGLETVEDVATLEQRWCNSWVTSPQSW